MSDYCDLHIHTTASDGQLSPDEVLSFAQSKNLKAISICDHDTISGYEQLCKLYPSLTDGTLLVSEMEVIPGIEISCSWDNREIHILGYFCDPGCQEFSEIQTRLKESRLKRVNLILDKLKSMGIHIDLSQVLEKSSGDSVGRPHIAQAMYENGYVKSVGEAFELYIGYGRPAYVERFRLTPFESIGSIRHAKGVPVWAHPQLANADHLLPELIENGLQGLEVYHPQHDRHAVGKYKSLASEHGLVITGGSDFHSHSIPYGATIGSYGVCYKTVEVMRSLAQR